MEPTTDPPPRHPRIEIRHWWRDEVLYATDTCCDLKSAAEEAVAAGASLVGASLVGASLDGARLVGASLDRASLVGASLDGASLVGASLVGARLDRASLDRASLDRASLDRASLDRARINWSSHDLIAELLLRECGQGMGPEAIGRRKVAGLVLVSRDWCWPDFLRLRRSRHYTWAIDTLARHVTDGDDAPAVLADRARELRAAAATA